MSVGGGSPFERPLRKAAEIRDRLRELKEMRIFV